MLLLSSELNYPFAAVLYSVDYISTSAQSFFFIGQWDWFVIAFLWSVIPLDSRLQSSTSDVMYTCKPILAFKVRFHAPLSPRRAPSKEISTRVRKVLQYWLTFVCDLLMCKEADKTHPKLETTYLTLSVRNISVIQWKL